LLYPSYLRWVAASLHGCGLFVMPAEHLLRGISGHNAQLSAWLSMISSFDSSLKGVIFGENQRNKKGAEATNDLPPRPSPRSMRTTSRASRSEQGGIA